VAARIAKAISHASVTIDIISYVMVICKRSLRENLTQRRFGRHGEISGTFTEKSGVKLKSRAGAEYRVETWPVFAGQQTSARLLRDFDFVEIMMAGHIHFETHDFLARGLVADCVRNGNPRRFFLDNELGFFI
jgi:hypothetical protein